MYITWSHTKKGTSKDNTTTATDLHTRMVSNEKTIFQLSPGHAFEAGL